jgi:hypothetical protein
MSQVYLFSKYVPSLPTGLHVAVVSCGLDALGPLNQRIGPGILIGILRPNFVSSAPNP